MDIEKMKSEAAIRDMLVNEDTLTVENALGPFAPELRRAIRWVAYRAAAREATALGLVLDRRSDELDENAAREGSW